MPWNPHIRKSLSHFNPPNTRELLNQEYQESSRRLAVVHLEYLRESELLEDLLSQ